MDDIIFLWPILYVSWCLSYHRHFTSETLAYFLILLGVFIVAICASGSENSDTEKLNQTGKTNVNRNRIRMEGKIGASKPKEDKGVTQDYATYYTIFRGKK